MTRYGCLPELQLECGQAAASASDWLSIKLVAVKERPFKAGLSARHLIVQGLE